MAEKKSEPAAAKRKAPKDPAPAKSESAPAKAKKSAGPKAPRRPTLDPESVRLLGVRRSASARRARFTRQASYRYYRIGRDGSWRAPRGLQSKQRRHYQYRSTVVSIGFRGPAAVRGRTSTGFVPVLVRTSKEIERLRPTEEAAVIARSVGTRRRLTLEETARQKGVHVLNPLEHEREE